MAHGHGKDVVLGVVLAAVLLHGGLLVLRARGLIGARWTDGQQWRASDSGELRHAVWDEAEAFGELGCAARDPALSPDGRWLVVAVGERGADADLAVCELVDGVPGPARLLAELNTSSDELAPAFARDLENGALYFASDRPGGEGGLDLWRASCSGGALGPAEHVGGGVSSPADDTDPAPLASGALVFASDRSGRGDHDLFEADVVGDAYVVTPLDALDTTFEEREPDVAPDDRALYFASDRPGAGGFDLLRSLRADGRWLAPVPLRSLNGPGDERGPWASADGTRLLYSSRDADGGPRILSARSRELYLVPPRPPSARERWVFAGLGTLAAAALLARLWRVLNVYHRALLASLVLHVALLVFMSGHYSRITIEEPGGDALHRLQLVPAPELAVSPAELETRLEEQRQALEDERVATESTAALALVPLAAAARPPEAPPPEEVAPAPIARTEAAPIPVAPLEAPRVEVAGVEVEEQDASSAASAPPPPRAESAAAEVDSAPSGAPAPPPPELGAPEGTPREAPAPVPVAAKAPESSPPPRQPPPPAPTPESPPPRASEHVALPATRAPVEVAPQPEIPEQSPVASSAAASAARQPETPSPAGDAHAASDAEDAREVAELMRDPALLAAAAAELGGEERRGFATVLLATPEEQLAIARFFGEELVLVPRQTLDPGAQDPHWFRVAPEDGHVEELRGRPALEQYRQYRDLFDYEYSRLPETLRELRRSLLARGDVYLFAALLPAREWAVVIARRAEALARSGRDPEDVRTFVLRYRPLAGGSFDLAVDHVVFADGSRYTVNPTEGEGALIR